MSHRFNHVFGIFHTAIASVTPLWHVWPKKWRGSQFENCLIGHLRGILVILSIQSHWCGPSCELILTCGEGPQTVITLDLRFWERRSWGIEEWQQPNFLYCWQWTW
jgi:hypothetical protein